MSDRDEYYESCLASLARDPAKRFYAKLRSGLYHVTSADGFRGMCRDEAILPNDGSRPFTFPQSANSQAFITRAVSLFDFGAATDREFVGQIHNWGSFFRRHRPVTLVLGLNRALLPARLVPYRQSHAQLGYKHTIIPHVEVLHPAPIPLAAVEHVFLVQAHPFRYRHFNASYPLLRRAEELAVRLWGRRSRAPLAQLAGGKSGRTT